MSKSRASLNAHESAKRKRVRNPADPSPPKQKTFLSNAFEKSAAVVGSTIRSAKKFASPEHKDPDVPGLGNVDFAPEAAAAAGMATPPQTPTKVGDPSQLE